MITQSHISRRSISNLTFSFQSLCLVYQNICLFVGARGSTFCFSFHCSSCSFRFLYNPGNFKLLFLISHLLRFWPYLHHCITALLNFPCYAIRLHCHYLPELTSCRSLNFQTLKPSGTLGSGYATAPQAKFVFFMSSDDVSKARYCVISSSETAGEGCALPEFPLYVPSKPLVTFSFIQGFIKDLELRDALK